MTQPLSEKRFHEPISAHLRRDFTALRSDQTVDEALQSLRTRQLAEEIVYFYVLDETGRLTGVVPTRRLLMSAPETPISEIMVRQVITIPDTATVLEACEFFILHRLLAFPVVDRDKRLLGVVEVGLFTEGVFDVAENKSAEAAFQLIGIHLARKRHSPLAGFKDRFPWLLANITGGLLCALVAALYEDLLDVVVVLALFIPIVLALAESVSIQSVTLTLQEFTTSRVDWRGFAASLGKEFLTAALLGLASGGLVAAVVWIWKSTPLVALVIWASITLSMITACLLGVALPTIIHALRKDPTVAAGPIVLATADIATLLVYFNLAGILLARA